MNFRMTKAFLGLMMIGAVAPIKLSTAANQNERSVAADDRDMEDFEYWRDLVEGMASVVSGVPSPTPNIEPSPSPSGVPSDTPSLAPTFAPSTGTSSPPSAGPSPSPSSAPTGSVESAPPSGIPSPTPSSAPSSEPSFAPTLGVSSVPSATPSVTPSLTPTSTPLVPTEVPVVAPTDAPVVAPTDAPVVAPTDAPVTAPTDAPVTAPTDAPVTAPTDAPFVAPTDAPVTAPTDAPVVAPTDAPVTAPTDAPVVAPSGAPVAGPTDAPAPVTSVESRLIPFALQGIAEFQDPNSYQSQALLKVAAQVGVETFSDAKLTQYYALYCIYNATNTVPNPITDTDPRFDGAVFPSWLVATGWTETTLDPCNGWFGISCDDQSRVTNIDLFQNLLTGYFPPEVVLLALDGPFSTGAGNLFRIDVFQNDFLWNNNDNTWMTNLGSNMNTIIVDETAFSGDIPRLPENLTNFDASFAFFSGGLVDANFEGINSLNFVDLDGNAFNTTVPTVFGRLPNLQFLYLSDAFLSGDLSYMAGMPAMREHWIDTNPGLSGPIFDFVGAINTLESFSVTFSSLTGTIPATLGQLVNMKQMWLYANTLTGGIPTELGLLRSMARLQVEGNEFVGAMPAEVCANTVFPNNVLTVLGADCEDPLFECSCCTCCSVLECTI